MTAALLAVALGGAGCASAPPPPTVTLPAVQPASPSAAPAKTDPVLAATAFQALSGWGDDAVDAGLGAFLRSCPRFEALDPAGWVGDGPFRRRAAAWQALCRDARALPPGDAAAARAFLEARTVPMRLSAGPVAEGLVTGYYEAGLDAAEVPGPGFTVPIHGRPADLVQLDLGAFVTEQKGRRSAGRLQGNRLVPYAERAAIEDGRSGSQIPVLLWAADPVDVHILQIQGSGIASLPDGRRVRIGYAGDNGHPFVGLGALMREEGIAPPGGLSMPAIREWLKANPERARGLMRRNPRYIFFRRIEGDGPIGAFGVPLTPGRSVAVDPAHLPLGIPLWLDTSDPDGKPIRRLVVAQDTGAAIKGVVRIDYFWGAGEPAFFQAGRMRSPGRVTVLLPAPGPSS